jgi:hypothetical protein
MACSFVANLLKIGINAMVVIMDMSKVVRKIIRLIQEQIMSA